MKKLTSPDKDMITVTLSFDTPAAAMAALQRLQDEKAGTDMPEPTKAAPAPASQAVEAVSRTDKEARIFFRDTLAKEFVALGDAEDGPAKQQEVVDFFGVDKLSRLDPARYDEARAFIRRLHHG